MARIEKYIQDNNITDKDIVLGSDGDNNNKTKNYTVDGLKKYITKDFDASEQNNVIKSYSLDTSELSEQFVESQTSNELAAYLINRIEPALEVKSDEIYFFKMAKGNKFYTLSLSNLGKGIYGLEGTQIDKSNVQIISEKSLSANSVVEDSTTDSYDLGSIKPLNVSQALNLKNPPIDIKPLSQGFTIFNTVENGEVKSYLYQGSSGLTGLNENQTVLDDFDLIDQQGFEPGDPIPEYLLGLDDNDLLLRKDSTEVSRIGIPIANLSYTASPNEGKVVTDKGTDATIPLADNTNAGLLSPSEKEEIAKVSNKADKDGNNIFTGDNEFTQPIVIPASTNDNEAVAYGQVFPDRSWYEQISMDVSKRSTFEDHSSEVSLAKIDDVLYRVFRLDPSGDHVGNEGACYIQKSYDGGANWTEKEIAKEDNDYDVRNYVLGAINDKLILFYRMYDHDTSTHIGIFYVTSDDGGNTWSSETDITSEFNDYVSIPFGKVFSDGTKHYTSFYTGQNDGHCEWLESTDGGNTWQFSKVIYDAPISGESLNEPFFEYVGNNTFIGLIRKETGSPNPFYQIVSTDGGDTWSAPTPTNHANEVDLRTAPQIYYDDVEDVIYTISMPRIRYGTTTPKEADTPYNYMYLYANKPSELLGNSTNYRLISKQRSKWQRSFLYGYPSMIKIDEGNFVINYTEQYYFGQKQYADIFQFYVNSKTGKQEIAPTIEENYRVKNEFGLWESRDFDPFDWNRTALNDVFPARISQWNDAYGWGNFKDYGLGGYKGYVSADFSEITTDSQFFLATNTTGFPVAGRSYEGIKIANSGTSTTSTTIVVDRTDTTLWWKRGSDEWKRAISSLDGALLYKGGITNGTNLDTLSEGYYIIAGGTDVGTLTGFPSDFISSGGDVIVEVWNTGAYIHQKIVKRESASNTIIVERVANSGGNFNDWVKVVTTGDISNWDDKENAFTKNTAFNKNFGTSSGTVSEGNHTHPASDITSGVFSYSRLPFSSTDVGNWNTAYGWGNWATGVDKAFVDNLNIDADTLDGQHGSYYLNYNNFTNTPDLSSLQEIEYADDFDSLPTTGNADKVYITTDTGYMYRWNGSGYSQLTDQTAIWGQVSGTLSNQADLQNALNGKEDSFGKNTAFNKNFGASSGTVARGNDSRILNGQTAFSWGDHSQEGYALDSNVVHLTGNETIDDTKTFTQPLLTTYSTQSADGTAGSGNIIPNGISFGTNDSEWESFVGSSGNNNHITFKTSDSRTLQIGWGFTDAHGLAYRTLHSSNDNTIKRLWDDSVLPDPATETYVDNNVFSGNYNDLSNKPTIPTNNNQLTNGAGYITSSALNGYATEDYVDQQEVNVVTSPTATVSIDIREYKSSVINVTNDFTINLTNLPDSKKSIVHNITLNYQGTQRNIQLPSGSGTNLFGDTLGADPSKTYLVTIEAINISNSTNPIMIYNIAVSEAS